MSAEAEGDHPVAWRVGNLVSRRAAARVAATAREVAGEGAMARALQAAALLIAAIPRHGQNTIAQQFHRLDHESDETQPSEDWAD
jgi:hypothetical protein